MKPKFIICEGAKCVGKTYLLNELLKNNNNNHISVYKTFDSWKKGYKKNELFGLSQQSIDLMITDFLCQTKFTHSIIFDRYFFSDYLFNKKVKENIKENRLKWNIKQLKKISHNFDIIILFLVSDKKQFMKNKKRRKCSIDYNDFLVQQKKYELFFDFLKKKVEFKLIKIKMGDDLKWKKLLIKKNLLL